MKESYERAEMEVVYFEDQEDIIMTSDCPFDNPGEGGNNED